MEALWLNIERVLTIDLNQIEKEFDVVIANERMEKEVAPAILIDVAEVARARGIETAGDLEGVIIALHVPKP